MGFFYVGIGGFLGSCLRYFIGLVVKKINGTFPLATLFANILAAFIIGLVISFEIYKLPFDKNVKLLITTGFLGGLSTFSTFSLETVQLFQKGFYFTGFLNIILNISLSLFFVYIGFLFFERCA